MEVTVNMKAEEFQEFMAWKRTGSGTPGKWPPSQVNGKSWQKVTWAIEEDPKRPGKVKIVDQEHAAELLELANDYLS